eukprot:jgi/Tetstr1/439543/TSEL_027972.t1
MARQRRSSGYRAVYGKAAPFFFCLAAGPVLEKLIEGLGDAGLGAGFADDLHLLGSGLGITAALHAAALAFAAIGMQVAWGPGKTEVHFYRPSI